VTTGRRVRRVAVTGLGVVSSIGTGRRALWDALLAGVSGIGPVLSFDTSRYPVHQGGEIRDFRPEDHLRVLSPEEVGRASQLAASAARLALDDSGLDPSSLEADRSGVAMGTTSGEPREVEAFDDRVVEDELARVGPEFMDLYPCHSIASAVAAEVGFGGVNAMIPTACAAGNYAIAYAADALAAIRMSNGFLKGAACKRCSTRIRLISGESCRSTRCPRESTRKRCAGSCVKSSMPF
jgi:3-oxoacyl-[acyl-carrier-protein] synthase II